MIYKITDPTNNLNIFDVNHEKNKVVIRASDFKIVIFDLNQNSILANFYARSKIISIQFLWGNRYLIICQYHLFILRNYEEMQQIFIQPEIDEVFFIFLILRYFVE